MMKDCLRTRHTSSLCLDMCTCCAYWNGRDFRVCFILLFWQIFKTILKRTKQNVLTRSLIWNQESVSTVALVYSIVWFHLLSNVNIVGWLSGRADGGGVVGKKKKKKRSRLPHMTRATLCAELARWNMLCIYITYIARAGHHPPSGIK